MPYTPEWVVETFGPPSSVAKRTIGALCAAIARAESSSAKLCFDRSCDRMGVWLGARENEPAKLGAELALLHSVDHPTYSFQQILFAIQTFVVLLAKLLALRSLADTRLPSVLHIATAVERRRLVQEMESGRLFQALGVENFHDPDDVHAWYEAEWSDAIDEGIADILANIDKRASEVLIGPEEPTRDLFKPLHKRIFPRSLRHALGEYYTPDWLAEHVLDGLDYAGNPAERVLDPACGSGTFLLAVMGRMRSFRKSLGAPMASTDEEFLARVLECVVGFDANPVAVWTAKTNYLLSIRDVASRASSFEVPVHLRDALSAGDTIAEWGSRHGHADHVVGNPPWVNWNHIAEGARRRIVDLYQNAYDLFPHKGVRARHGSASIDLATLFVYVAADHYLAKGGKLGMILPQSVFKSRGSSEGFRRFCLPNGRPLGVFRVDDISSFQPFGGAQTRTAVVYLRSGEKTNYPLRYVRWDRSSSSWRKSLDARPDLVATELNAWPSQSDSAQSPWITAARNHADCVRKIFGRSPFAAKLGVHTWLNGAYWLERNETADAGLRRIVNAADAGKKKLERIETLIEASLVYPLLRGRDVRRWRASPSMSIVLPHLPSRPGMAISERTLEAEFPHAYLYFDGHRKALESRSGYRKFLRPARGPFYGVYNIGPYTFQRHRVVWREQANSIQACVLSTATGERIIIPDHKLTLLGFDDETQAHFVCALLNTSAVRFAVHSYAMDTQMSTHVCEVVRLPSFDSDNETHHEIARIGRACHLAARHDSFDEVARLEKALDACSGGIWGLSTTEVDMIRAADPSRLTP